MGGELDRQANKQTELRGTLEGDGVRWCVDDVSCVSPYQPVGSR